MKAVDIHEPLPFRKQDLKLPIQCSQHSCNDFMTSSALWHLEDTASSSTPQFLHIEFFPPFFCNVPQTFGGAILNLGLSSQKLLSVLWIVIFVDYWPMQKEDFLMNAGEFTNQ